VVVVRDLQGRAALQCDVRQRPDLEPRGDPVDRLLREVQTGPARSTPDQLLGLRTLPEADLEHVLAAPVHGVQAGQDVALLVVAPRVVLVEELWVVVVEPLVESPDDVVPAGPCLPERAHALLGHHASRITRDHGCLLSAHAAQGALSSGRSSGSARTAGTP